MAGFSIKMILLDKAPTDDDNARAISLFLTRNHGRHGWEPVTAYPQGDKLVVMLKKNEVG
jgi:hypothetical protein